MINMNNYGDPQNLVLIGVMLVLGFGISYVSNICTIRNKRGVEGGNLP